MMPLRNLLLLAVIAIVSCQDPNAASTSSTPDAPPTSTPDAKKKEPPTQSFSTFNAKEHTDWGGYYDPQNVFCGKYDCYAILGFDYENYGQPDRKEITQRYRSLSREWHPDKNKKKDAKERFVKIARAYEVLTDETVRQEYDYMRYNQEAYFQKHGSSVLWQYAPKSDAMGVVLMLLVIGSVISWFVQRAKWQNVAIRLVNAAVEDLGPREGGTAESKALRKEAMDIITEREKDENNADTAAGAEDAKKKKKMKLTATEKKQQLQESLRPIIADLVENWHEDFGAGFHKPTWKDLLLVKVFQFPYYFVGAVIWNTKYVIRRLMKKELSDEEREILTIRAVGDIAWHSASEEERKEWKTKDLWISLNMLDWEEDQEIKTLCPSDQKRFARMKKKGKKIDWSKEE
jgi:curved DNA-binding protein CbpA